MQRLLQFLYRYRAFILFLVLEGICIRIIVKNNAYQGSKFFNTTASISGSILSTEQNIRTYFNLIGENQTLAAENGRLKQIILDLSDNANFEIDTTAGVSGIAAKVLDNSLFFKSNYIIIDKGTNDGVIDGMGVVGQSGIVGQVKSATSNYAMISSVLHNRAMVSSLHRASGALCSTVWNGDNPRYANVNFLPRHVHLAVGDTITTSGFNAIYPENYAIGVIENVSIADDATFYNVIIKLTTDYYKLSYVYLLDLKEKPEMDSLRTTIKSEIDG